MSNSLMACKPQHHFFKHVIENLEKYSEHIENNDILSTTGPYMLTEVFREYNKLEGMFTKYDVITLAQPDDFQPRLDESMLDSMREKCINNDLDLGSAETVSRQRALCDKLLDMTFKNQPKATSYTVHYWTHTWAGPKHDPWNIHGMQSTFNVKEILTFFLDRDNNN